jgi:hypothetical protein
MVGGLVTRTCPVPRMPVLIASRWIALGPRPPDGAAIPKSLTTALPSPSRMFSGLMSPCLRHGGAHVTHP